jgi:hypothetical protein
VRIRRRLRGESYGAFDRWTKFGVFSHLFVMEKIYCTERRAKPRSILPTRVASAAGPGKPGERLNGALPVHGCLSRSRMQSQGEPNMAGSTRGKSNPIHKSTSPAKITTSDTRKTMSDRPHPLRITQLQPLRSSQRSISHRATRECDGHSRGRLAGKSGETPPPDAARRNTHQPDRRGE